MKALKVTAPPPEVTAGSAPGLRSPIRHSQQHKHHNKQILNVWIRTIFYRVWIQIPRSQSFGLRSMQFFIESSYRFQNFKCSNSYPRYFSLGLDPENRISKIESKNHAIFHRIEIQISNIRIQIRAIFHRIWTHFPKSQIFEFRSIHHFNADPIQIPDFTLFSIRSGSRYSID